MNILLKIPTGEFQVFSGPVPALSQTLKVTGFGALSEERYVYEADVNNGYRHTNNNQCWSTCVKMVRFDFADGIEQYLDLHGITISEPPYHSFIVSGDEQSFHMSVQLHQQIGSWYLQTDGLEIYPQSLIENCFFSIQMTMFSSCIIRMLL